MRLPRPRFSVKWMLIMVLAAGVAVRLLMAASEASPGHVFHIRKYEDTGRLAMKSHRLLEADEAHGMTYWSRYWRRAFGLPLVDDPCRCKAYFEVVEGRRTIDVLTTTDLSRADALLNWTAAYPGTLPRTEQELRSAPPRRSLDGRTRVSTRRYSVQ